MAWVSLYLGVRVRTRGAKKSIGTDNTIRPIRRELKQLRADGAIDNKTYRLYYRHSKGGLYRNKNHMLTHMHAGGVLKKGGD